MPTVARLVLLLLLAVSIQAGCDEVDDDRPPATDAAGCSVGTPNWTLLGRQSVDAPRCSAPTPALVGGDVAAVRRLQRRVHACGLVELDRRASITFGTPLALRRGSACVARTSPRRLEAGLPGLRSTLRDSWASSSGRSTVLATLRRRPGRRAPGSTLRVMSNVKHPEIPVRHVRLPAVGARPCAVAERRAEVALAPERPAREAVHPGAPARRHDRQARVGDVDDHEVAVACGVEPLAERVGQERIDPASALEEIELVDPAVALADAELRDEDRRVRVVTFQS